MDPRFAVLVGEDCVRPVVFPAFRNFDSGNETRQLRLVNAAFERMTSRWVLVLFLVAFWLFDCSP